MNWLDFVASYATARALAFALFGIAALIAAIGYRSAARALALTIVCAAVAGAVVGQAGVLVGLALTGPGEGAGVAALIFGLAAGCGAAALTFAAGCAWIHRRRAHYFVQSDRSAMLGTAGVILLALAVAAIALRLPQLRSAGALANISATGFDIGLDGSALDELRARGTDAVPAIIDSLHQTDPADLRVFENGLNMGEMDQIALLGEIGGPAAIAELRLWLSNGEYAPDIRAAAARALGDARDTESAPVIGALLEERSYEWRKCHADLILALRWLDAETEVGHIVSALRFDPAEDGSSFQIGLLEAGIGALKTIDTAESQAAIDQLLANATPQQREQIQRVLDAFDANLTP